MNSFFFPFLMILNKNLSNYLQRTKRNKIYLSRIKTYTNRCLFYLKKQLMQQSVDYSSLIFKNLNLAYSSLDKAKKRKIIRKQTVSRKKSKLQNAVNKINLT